MEYLVISVLCILGAYAFAIAAFQRIEKTDTITAKAFIDAALLDFFKFFKDLLSNDVKIQYVPDGVLIQKLMESLAPYNELPIAYTEWQYFKYSSFELPAIRIQLICRTEDNFPIIRNILNNVFKQHLAECGLQDFYSGIHIEKSGEGCYHLILIYAISDIEKENIKKWAMIKKKQAESIAKKSVQAVVDDELENELKKSEIDDEEK